MNARFKATLISKGCGYMRRGKYLLLREIDGKIRCSFGGAISHSGKFIIEMIDGTMNAKIYVDILKKRLLKSFPTQRPDSPKCQDSWPLIFQHDGASSHLL